MRDDICNIVENIQIQGEYYLLKIHSEYISTRAIPGNFIMISASSAMEPLLKRPFGIFETDPPYIWVYYQVVGKGSRLVSELKPGDKISVLGPLGNSFPPVTNQSILMIAGGRGIAPIHFAIKKYQKENKISLIYGARSKHDLNLLDLLKPLTLQALLLYSDDGSIGKRGNVTTDLRKTIQKSSISITFSCGPDNMVKSIYQVTRELKTRDYASLEALMGCGFGICYSCVIQTKKSGYQKVCTDGPIFDMDEIAW